MSRGAFFKAVEIMAQCDEIDGVITLGFGYGQANVAAIESAPDKDTPDYVSYIEATRNSDLRGMQFLLDTIATYRKPTLLASEYIVGADRDCNEAVLELRRKNVLIYPSSRRPAQVNGAAGPLRPVSPEDRFLISIHSALSLQGKHSSFSRISR